MTNEQFESILKTTRVKPQTADAALAVLVNGEKQIEVAMRYGFTKQRMNNIVRRFQIGAEELGLAA